MLSQALTAMPQKLDKLFVKAPMWPRYLSRAPHESVKLPFISSNMHLPPFVYLLFRQDSLPTMRGNGEEIGLGVGRQRSIHCFRLG